MELAEARRVIDTLEGTNKDYEQYIQSHLRAPVTNSIQAEGAHVTGGALQGAQHTPLLYSMPPTLFTTVSPSVQPTVPVNPAQSVTLSPNTFTVPGQSMSLSSEPTHQSVTPPGTQHASMSSGTVSNSIEHNLCQNYTFRSNSKWN